MDALTDALKEYEIARAASDARPDRDDLRALAQRKFARVSAALARAGGARPPTIFPRARRQGPRTEADWADIRAAWAEIRERHGIPGPAAHREL